MAYGEPFYKRFAPKKLVMTSRDYNASSWCLASFWPPHEYSMRKVDLFALMTDGQATIYKWKRG